VISPWAKIDQIWQMVRQLMINVAALQAAVAAETTVDKSVLTLIQGLVASQQSLSTQLAAAIAANDPVALAAVQSAIDASVATMTDNAAQLSAAVTANTPAPTTTAPPTGA